MIIDGKKIAEEVVRGLEALRTTLPEHIKMGVVLGADDPATESFVRIKFRLAERLRVDFIKEELPANASTEDALAALERLMLTAHGIIVQLPLPTQVAKDIVLMSIPFTHDIDAIGQEPHRVLAPVAGAVKEILERAKVDVEGQKVVVVGAGRLVGKPCAEMLDDMGAKVSVVTLEQGSLESLKDADIIVSGAGSPGLIKPDMIKKGVVLIDAGTSELGGKLVGDADPACAKVASVFTPVPGGVGPIAVAMLFKNLFALVGPKSN